jgi:hypothetical protein
VAGERLAESLPPPLDARFVIHEGTEPLAIRGWTRRPWRRVAVAARPVGRLHEAPEEALDLADAEVFAERELAGVAAELYRRRMATAGAREVIAGEPFRRRGESLVLLAHPWQPAGEPAGARLRRAGAELRGTLPAELAAGEVASLEVWLPEPLPATAPEVPETPESTGEPAASEPPALSVGGEAVPLIATRSRGGAVRWLSARFRVEEPGGPVALALPGGREAPAEAELTVRRWRR